MLTITASFNLEESSSWPKPYVRPFSPHPSPLPGDDQGLRWLDSWGRAALPTADAVHGPEGERRRQALSPPPALHGPGTPIRGHLIAGPWARCFSGASAKTTWVWECLGDTSLHSDTVFSAGPAPSPSCRPWLSWVHKWQEAFGGNWEYPLQ